MSLFEEKRSQIQDDPYQNAAFLSNKSTVVKAGPGSGKTSVLTLKLMQLLNEKIKFPRGLACITYNKEAAKEFQSRLKELGLRERKNVFLGTVHAFCIAEVITPYAHLYKYDIPLPLKIISKADQKQLFKDVLEHLEATKKRISITMMNKERALQIEGVSRIETPINRDVSLVAREYEKRLLQLGKVDFTSIVKFATLLIQNQPYVRKCLEAKFPWILIDEYQDLGRPLHEMVLTLLNHTNIKIFAVGDPDQSIYSFGGGNPKYLNELFKDSRMEPIILKNNYRSHKDIVEAFLTVLDRDLGTYSPQKFFDKDAAFNLITCEKELNEQYEKVVQDIIPRCIEDGIPYEEICVLVKENKDVTELSLYFEDEGLPYYVSKFEFDRSDIVKWLEDCALWITDRRKASFNELFNFWINLLTKHNNELDNQMKHKKRIEFLNILTKSMHYKENLYRWLYHITTGLKLLEILAASDIYPDEVNNLEELLQLTKDGTYSDYDVEKFAHIRKPNNQVTLSTRHSSKGLEFEVVIMLGMEHTIFPSYRSLNNDNPSELEEETRLFFVCVSRSKRVCYFLRSKKLTKDTKYGTRTDTYAPSMFWKIIKDIQSNKTTRTLPNC